MRLVGVLLASGSLTIAGTVAAIQDASAPPLKVSSASGCVSAALVTRSLVPALDFAALQAVAGWRFEPARLNDRPVVSTMTVTVNFALR